MLLNITFPGDGKKYAAPEQPLLDMLHEQGLEKIEE